MTPGPNAPRFHAYIQMSVYNGWKKHHGFKFQTVEAPNGMCIHMYGPRSYRTNDLDLLHDSQINQLVAQAQAGQDLQYSIYVDGIYVPDTHTRSRCEGILTKMRIANEWDYMSTSSLFPFVKFKERRRKVVQKQYIVATLLRNAHLCLYDGITADYYECSAPSLEDYFLPLGENIFQPEDVDSDTDDDD